MSQLAIMNKQKLAALAHAAQQLRQERSSGLPLLKFNKVGQYVLGRDGDLIDEGTEILVPLESLATGFVAWEGGMPKSVMKPLTEGPVDESTLPPTTAKRGWEPQVGFGVILPDGTRAVYQSSTAGGRMAFADLVDDIGQHVAEALSSEAELPTVARVRLGSRSYTHPEYGRLFSPVFELVEVGTGSDIQALPADASAPWE